MHLNKLQMTCGLKIIEDIFIFKKNKLKYMHIKSNRIHVFEF